MVSQEDGDGNGTRSNLDIVAKAGCPQYEYMNYCETRALFKDLRDRYVAGDPRRALDVEAYMLRNSDGWSFTKIAEHQGCKRQAASARHLRVECFMREHRHLFC